MPDVMRRVDVLSPSNQEAVAARADELREIWHRHRRTYEYSPPIIQAILTRVGVDVDRDEGRCGMCGNWWSFRRLVVENFDRQVLLPHVCPSCVYDMSGLVGHGLIGRNDSIRRVTREITARRTANGFTPSSDAYVGTVLQWRQR